MNILDECYTFILRFNVFFNFFPTDYDECGNSPCQNGGTCINNDGSFTCICKAGWEGRECQNGTNFRTSQGVVTIYVCCFVTP